MINKIAKKVMTAFLRTHNKRLNNEINYAKQLSNSLNKYFQNDLLKNKIIKYVIPINTINYIDYLNREYNIIVILFYKDKLNKEDYIDGIMRDYYPVGQGQAIIKNKNELYIVMYGSSKQEDKCFDLNYFKDCFTHEMMHLLDHCADNEQKYQQYYYGHPDQNNEIQFPGMNGLDDDIWEQRFAQYFTCMSQKRQYIYDLLQSIEHYSNVTKIKQKDIVNIIIKALSNKLDFLNFIQEFKKSHVNYAPFALLYHLTFSKQKNGNKETAIKLLQELY